MAQENHLPTDPNVGADPNPPADDQGAPDPQDTPAPADDPERADDTPPAGDDAGDDGGTDGGDPADRGRRGGAQARIQELVAERNAAMEFGQYWQQRALELMRQTGAAPAKDGGPGGEPADDPEPRLEDFDSTEKWAEAFRAWTRRQIETTVDKTVEQKTRSQREEEQRAAVLTAWNERLTKFVEEQPDALAVISARTLPITEHMRDVILASEIGPQIAYHLGKNPATAARIARMSPTQQAAAIGRLEGQLLAQQQVGAPSPSSAQRKAAKPAPPPPSPVDGGSRSEIDLDKCSLQEFMAYRLGQRRGTKSKAPARR